MKKIIMIVGMMCLTILIGGCNRNGQSNEEATVTVAPTAVPTNAAVVEDTIDEDSADAVNNTDISNTTEEVAGLTVKDYYPLLADTEYIYEGQGNEFAFYNRVTDYIDAEANRIQTRTNNGGTETVRVIEIKDGKVSVIKALNECYYRENLMTDAVAGEDAEILLMEPLVKGTEWTLPDGRKRYISEVGVVIDSTSITEKAIEVTTESADSISKDYYVPQIGLVKSVFGSGDMEISSTLKEVKFQEAYTQGFSIFHPDADEKIYVEQLSLEFRTGDDTRQVIQEAITGEVTKESYLPLASIKTKLNRLYLGEDNIVHADFSKELVNDMNAGAGYEALILQSITNTLGNYYGVEEVLITLEGKPYESGHILMNEGETFHVNYDNVIYQ